MTIEELASEDGVLRKYRQDMCGEQNSMNCVLCNLASANRCRCLARPRRNRENYCTGAESMEISVRTLNVKGRLYIFSREAVDLG
jgi:hypothetical protein